MADVQECLLPIHFMASRPSTSSELFGNKRASSAYILARADASFVLKPVQKRPASSVYAPYFEASYGLLILVLADSSRPQSHAPGVSCAPRRIAMSMIIGPNICDRRTPTRTIVTAVSTIREAPAGRARTAGEPAQARTSPMAAPPCEGKHNPR